MPRREYQVFDQSSQVEWREDPNVLIIPMKAYGLHVIVSWESPLQKVLQHCRRNGCKLSREWVKDAVEFTSTGNGACMNLGPGNTDVLCWVKSKLSKKARAGQFGVLYHELYHAVDKIAKSHAFEDEMEHKAYIFTYLIDICNKFFWR